MPTDAAATILKRLASNSANESRKPEPFSKFSGRARRANKAPKAASAAPRARSRAVVRPFAARKNPWRKQATQARTRRKAEIQAVREGSDASARGSGKVKTVSPVAPTNKYGSLARDLKARPQLRSCFVGPGSFVQR
jgi:hypothetical protein